MDHWQMTMRLLIFTLTALACGASASAQQPAAAARATPARTLGPFNFTPAVLEENFDGVIAKVAVFKDGFVAMRVNQPIGWVAAGSSTQLYFTNAKIANSRITLRASTLEPPAKFDEAWLETIKPLILGSLPKDGTGQRIDNVTPNILNIRSWTSVEFKASYERTGRRVTTGWLFLRLEDGRLLEVVSTGPEESFGEIHAAVEDILRGWDLQNPGKAPNRP